MLLAARSSNGRVHNFPLSFPRCSPTVRFTLCFSLWNFSGFSPRSTCLIYFPIPILLKVPQCSTNSIHNALYKSLWPFPRIFLTVVSSPYMFPYDHFSSTSLMLAVINSHVTYPQKFPSIRLASHTTPYTHVPVTFSRSFRSSRSLYTKLQHIRLPLLVHRYALIIKGPAHLSSYIRMSLISILAGLFFFDSA